MVLMRRTSALLTGCIRSSWRLVRLDLRRRRWLLPPLVRITLPPPVTLKRSNEAMLKSLWYAYRDRRRRKRDMRRLWITRINAASRMNGMKYSRFMFGLKQAGVERTG